MNERLSNTSFQKKKTKTNLNNQPNQTHPKHAYLKIMNCLFKYGHMDKQETPGQTHKKEASRGWLQGQAA